ncbi:Rac GTPase-activating protein 1 [Tyrophagus putrescentiae]|nr:Rac GTPase-activating protein 1 [Tyrophagus putrescentiae]
MEEARHWPQPTMEDLNHDFSFHTDSNHFDDDGLNFDKTEDSINASLDRQISVICHNHNTKDGNGDNNANNNNRANNNIRRPYPSEISPTSNSSADSRNQQSSGTADSSSTHSDDRHSENCVTWAKTPSNKTYAKYVTSSPSLRSSAAVPPETIEKRRRLLRSASCKKIKLDLTRLDSRPHGQLQPKKIFKPNIICAPCGKTIGFCRKALLCADCHSVCHPSCASQLTLPCIPHYTPKAVKSGVHRKIVVSDFIDQSVRPFVPAILVHLCTEIERRGLGEEGLYRKCGSHRQIRQLKAKFLTSKTGPPSTRHLDIHVLCGVVKNFLRELDDPLVTRVLWHDFVRASDLTVHSQEKSNELLKRFIDLLPEPNRDTLAYLILHLHKVTDACLETKMTITSLSKIFGPTVVGSSSSSSTSTSSSGVIAENVKQNLTMQALLSLPTAYWEELLQGADVFKSRWPCGGVHCKIVVSDFMSRWRVLGGPVFEVRNLAFSWRICRWEPHLR